MPLAIITFLDGQVDNSLPLPPVYPSQGLPGFGGRPDQSLPPGAVQLPVYPFDPTLPDNSLPGPQPGPDNGLPVPGRKYVIKYLACKGLILVPDNTLPGTPEPK
jgi:hypothetical protein